MDVSNPTINVLVEHAGDWWTAQCLEHDIATQARTLDELHAEIDRLLHAHVAACENAGIEPFQTPAAPLPLWSKFENARAVRHELVPMLDVALRHAVPKPVVRIAT